MKACGAYDSCQEADSMAGYPCCKARRGVGAFTNEKGGSSTVFRRQFGNDFTSYGARPV